MSTVVTILIILISMLTLALIIHQKNSLFCALDVCKGGRVGRSGWSLTKILDELNL